MSVLPTTQQVTHAHPSSASLYVGDLSPDVSENKLYEVFNNIGNVDSVRVLRDHTTRRSLGYAYVNFRHADHAEKALDIMNYKMINDRPCRIMWSHRDPSIRKNGVGNIFVKNLHKDVDHETLRDTFASYGTIMSCKVQTHKITGVSLGYGFVHFERENDALEAINAANGNLIKGEKIIVSKYIPKDQRQQGFTNLYYKNALRAYSQVDIENLFRQFGEITSSRFMSAPADDEKKVCHAGFINFRSAEQAALCVTNLNGYNLGGKQLFVARAQNKQERQAELKKKNETLREEKRRQERGLNLFVKNLSDTIDDARLNEMFNRFGMITSGKVMIDEKTKKSKGFGFVCFQTPESAMHAVSMNGTMIDNKPLYVSMYQPKNERRAAIEQNLARRNKMPGNYNMAPFYQGGNMRGYPGGPVAWGGPGLHPMMSRPHIMHAPPNQQQFQLVPQQQPMQQGPGNRHGGVRNPPRAGGRQGRVNEGGHGMPRQGQAPGRDNRMRPGGPPNVAPQPAEVQIAVESGDLSTSEFIKAAASLPDQKRKHVFGERLFPLVANVEPELAPKITGMLLEMEDTEIVELLESQGALEKKIQEAITVLKEADADEHE